MQISSYPDRCHLYGKTLGLQSFALLSPPFVLQCGLHNTPLLMCRHQCQSSVRTITVLDHVSQCMDGNSIWSL